MNKRRKSRRQSEEIQRALWGRHGLLLSISMLWAGASCTPEKSGRLRVTVAPQVLFERAVAEMEAQNYESACPMLEEVTNRRPDGLGAKMALAGCYEQWGHLAGAWYQYRLVVRMSEGKPDQADRRSEAEKKATALYPRLSTVTVEVPEAMRKLPGFSLKWDGVIIRPDSFGKAIPVDMGTYTFEAEALEHEVWAENFDVENNGDQVRIRVQLEPKVRLNKWQVAGIAAHAGGAVAFGTALALALAARSAWDKSNEQNGGEVSHCDAKGNSCDVIGLAMRDKAQFYANTSLAVAVIGGVGLSVAGGIMLSVGASSKAKSGAESVQRWRKAHQRSLMLEVYPMGLGLHGTW